MFFEGFNIIRDTSLLVQTYKYDNFQTFSLFIKLLFVSAPAVFHNRDILRVSFHVASNP